jgi:hypothetical protein
MSQITNPSPLRPGSIDVVLPGTSDEVLGTVTGFSSAPKYVVASVLYEEGVIVQSGLVYDFNVLALNSNGFSWRLKVLGNEYWPGTSSITIKINYIWSSV